MENEWNRLSTYTNWPPTAEAYPSSLSRAGFHYTGQEDSVTCFYCRVRLGRWTPDDLPLNEHIKHSPSCRFALGEETGNIPIPGSPSVLEISRREAAILRGEEQREEEAERRTVADISFADVFDDGGRTHGRTESDNVCQSVPEPRMPTEGERPNPEPDARQELVEKVKEEIRTRKPPPGVLLYVVYSEMLLLVGKAFRPEYANISSRLESFQTWTDAQLQDPTRLAEAGFYFTGREDRVRCFACNGGLCNWEKEDIPLYEHHKWFTRCPFIKRCRENPTARAIIDEAERSETQNAPAKPEFSNTYKGSTETQADSATVSTAVNKPPAPQDISSLKEENSELRSRRECKVCYERKVEIVLLPCSHLVCCVQCSMQLSHCPVCRSKIQATIKAYI